MPTYAQTEAVMADCRAAAARVKEQLDVEDARLRVLAREIAEWRSQQTARRAGEIAAAEGVEFKDALLRAEAELRATGYRPKNPAVRVSNRALAELALKVRSRNPRWSYRRALEEAARRLQR